MTTLHSFPQKYSEEDLICLCTARYGWAIAEQLKDILNGDELEKQNYNALYYIYQFLSAKGERRLASEIKKFLKKEGYKLN